MTSIKHRKNGIRSAPNPDVPNDGLAPLTELPPLDSTPIMTACVKAHRALAELKGLVSAVPDSRHLLQGLSVREVQASSAIEGVLTTNDLLLQYGTVGADRANAATKEALLYGPAFGIGNSVLDSRGGFSTALFVEICRQIKPVVDDIRTQEVYIGNPYRRTRSYTPPANTVVIKSLLDDLAIFMNDDSSPMDPLVRMAVAHYQFEAIHPFIDGNGRTGRVLNILYLQHHGLLRAPILYLSEFILRHRGDYYEGLRNVTFGHEWESWVCYMLSGVSEVARDALYRIRRILRVRALVRERAVGEFTRPPSDALLDVFFARPYCTVADVQEAEGITRPTATRRLRDLESAGILKSRRLSRHRLFYIAPLISILTEEMPGDDLVTLSEDTLDGW